MIEMTQSQSAVVQNLKDAGCDQKLIQCFLEYQVEGNLKEQLKLLVQQRGLLLGKIHKNQKRIDCLDYLIRTMKKQTNK